MTHGWIPAYRKLFNREDWLRPTKKHPAGRREAWLDLCQQAQHHGYDHVDGIRLARGEVLVSLSNLEKRWAWTRMRVRWFLDRLSCNTMVSIVRNTPQGTVYRIVNYDRYAISGNVEQHTEEHSQQQLNNTATTPEQEGRRKKTTYTSDFEELWALARKGSKPAAFRHYKKAVPSKVSHDAVVAARGAHVKRASKPEYIKSLDLWIRDERWEEHKPGRNGKRSGALDRPNLLLLDQ